MTPVPAPPAAVSVQGGRLLGGEATAAAAQQQTRVVIVGNIDGRIANVPDAIISFVLRVRWSVCCCFACCESPAECIALGRVLGRQVSGRYADAAARLLSCPDLQVFAPFMFKTVLKVRRARHGCIACSWRCSN